MNEPRPFRLNYRHPLAKGLVAFGIEDGELEKPDPAMVELVAELEQAQAVVDKLPTYADTGEPFVPGRDPAWVRYGPNTQACVAAGGYEKNEWRYILHIIGNVGPANAYSTSEAAARKESIR